VAGKPDIEITGPEPWLDGFAGALPRYTAIPIRS
jgi:hypothetical protein